MSDPRHIPGCFGAYGQECVCVAPREAAVIPPDPARDARVAARRAEDARKASAALDRLVGDYYRKPAAEVLPKAYDVGWLDGYAAAGLHHNRHYGVAPCVCGCGGAAYDKRDGAEQAWLHSECSRAFGFAAGYDPNGHSDPCPGCSSTTGAWMVSA